MAGKKKWRGREIGYHYADRHLVDDAKKSVRHQSAEPPAICIGVSARALTPEARLALAVLEDAIGAIRRAGRTDARERDEAPATLVAEAREWIASDEEDDPMAFVSVCAHLGLDAEYVRATIAAAESHAEWAIDRKQRRDRVDPTERRERVLRQMRKWRRKRRRRLPSKSRNAI